MNRHPLSAVFGDMPEADLKQLSDDIKAHGLREPVIVYQDQVLDGWHRYRACEMAGVLPALKSLPETDDPIAFVASKNLHRRSLTPRQRADIAISLFEWRDAGRVEKEKSNGSRDPFEKPAATNTQMATVAHVSTSTIKRAKADTATKDQPEPKDTPRPPTVADKAIAEAEKWKAKFRESDELRAELAAEYEAAVLASQSEEDQLVKFQELTRTILTLESTLRIEQEKSNALVKEVKFLRRELKKLGWE